jgi:hypothetical protein
MITQEDFETRIAEAQALERTRYRLYEMALPLIRSDHEIAAYVLIMATWNFARFRYVTRTFDVNRFRDTIERIRPLFEKLAAESLRTADLTTLAVDIAAIYSALKDVVEQTGASKIMHFKQPMLFVMWDVAIRKHYHVPARCSPEDYVSFLRLMKDTFGHLAWDESERTFAKAIDEYNFGLVQSKKRPRGKGRQRSSIR